MKVLDVGAEINPNGNRGLQLIDSYPWKHNLFAINLSSQHIETIKKYYPQVNALVADACVLPWPDKYFDIVYSNAVIEHLGDFEKQKKMASEIMRVGKRWFVTTPNRWFPFEFHLRLPFVSWFPAAIYRKIGRVISYNHINRKCMVGIRHDELRLMTTKELKQCFRGSQVVKQRITVFPETLIVIA